MYPKPFSIDPLISGVKVMRPEFTTVVSPAAMEQLKESGQKVSSQVEEMGKWENDRLHLSGLLAGCAVTSLNLLIDNLELWPEWALLHTLFDTLVNYLATQVDAAVSPTWQEQVAAINNAMTRALMLPDEVL